MYKFQIGDIVERIGGWAGKMRTGDRDRVVGLKVFDDEEFPSLSLDRFGEYWYPENFKLVQPSASKG